MNQPNCFSAQQLRDYVLGRLDETLAVAQNPEGGAYPVGTVIQLIPTEAMVKRAPGFSPLTFDWEFFFLGVSASGTTIEARGTTEVVNGFGGNCYDCHVKAEPQWDLVCETDHGCDPIPLGPELTAYLHSARYADLVERGCAEHRFTMDGRETVSAG